MLARTEIRPGWLFYFGCVILTPLTLGIGTIVFLASLRNWPRYVDDKFIVLRNGQQIPWSACTNVVKYPGWQELVFGGTTVRFPYRSIAGGKQIIRQIREHLRVSPE